jgi:hypothetical protein
LPIEKPVRELSHDELTKLSTWWYQNNPNVVEFGFSHALNYMTNSVVLLNREGNVTGMKNVTPYNMIYGDQIRQIMTTLDH